MSISPNPASSNTPSSYDFAHVLRRVLLIGVSFAGALLISSSSCNLLNNNGPGTEPETSNVVGTFTSEEGGTLTTSLGHAVSVPIGAVPRNASGNAGTVAFSIEPGVTAPLALPTGYQQIGSVVKYGPVGFIFAQPLIVYLPATNETSPEGIVMLHYTEARGEWVRLPITDIVAETRKLGTAVRELGYFVLARSASTTMTTMADKDGTLSAADSEGGISYCATSDASVEYILTVKSVISLKYPSQASWYTDRNGVNTLVGQSASTTFDPTGTFPRHPTRMRLPQGVYEMWITKDIVRGWNPSTYTVPIVVTIDRPLNTDWFGTTGWIDLGCALPTGGTWRSGTPDTWPISTVPYGTGAFQATLSWVNSSSSITDIDLHLYGPNSMHVFYGQKRAPNGAFELDRDWTSPLGNATENIYSLMAIPAGEYVLKVRHFSGASKAYSVRVIRDGNVRTYSGTASGNAEVEIMRFTQ